MVPGHCPSSVPGASRGEDQLRLRAGALLGRAGRALRHALSGRAGAGDGAGCSPLPCQQICPGSGSPDSCSVWLQVLDHSPGVQSSLAAALTMAVPVQAVPPGQHLCQLVRGEPALALLRAVVLWGELCHHQCLPGAEGDETAYLAACK